MPSYSQCAVCKNFRGGGECEAFPAGIPAAIINNQTDHRRPIEGDDGIQFEARDDESHPFDRQQA